MSFLTILLAHAALWHSTFAHTVITYPGWRGNNLHTNGTAPEFNRNSIGIDYVNGTPSFPFGMEWMYPCGGMPLSSNRSLWPVNGGAVAFQPGWFPGHRVGFIYVNIGITQPGELAPRNMSFNVVPPFQIVGPSNDMYDGTVCLPQVPLPANANLKVGDNITIQVVESAQHGAALYNCADVTLAEPKDVARVDQTNCFNTSTIGIQYLFTTSSLKSAAFRSLAAPSLTLATLAILVAAVVVGFV